MTLPEGGASRITDSIRSPVVDPKAKVKATPPAGLGKLDISPSVGAQATRGMFGCVERVDGKGLSGWLIDMANPETAQSIVVTVDGVQVMAGQVRFDASAAEGTVDPSKQAVFSLRWNQIKPKAGLPPPSRRKGLLQVLSEDGRALPFASAVSKADLYDWLEPHFDRLAFVLGTPRIEPPEQLSDSELLREYFDANFYLLMYPEAVDAPAAALDHFLHKGYKLGHDPHPDFSSRYYLDANPDVRQAGINPFVHYLRAGRHEGRLPRAPGGYRTEVLRQLVPLNETIKSWRRGDSLRALSAASVLTRIREELGGMRPKGIVLSVSHDDYTTNVGGVQLCLAIEQQAFNEQGQLYLHLSPWQAVPALHQGRDPERVALRVVCNGVEIGNTLGSDLCAAIDELRDDLIDLPAYLAVHALHGHAPENIEALHKALRPTKSFFWLHDFFTLCTGHNLLRNQIDFCHAPPPGSPACTICVYGEARDAQLRRITALFDAVPFTAVSPSAHTAELWRRKTGLRVQAVLVHPHCKMVVEGRRIGTHEDEPAEETETPTAAPIRVAYLGHPTTHKGWPVFCELVRQCCSSGRYEFWHLGTSPDPTLPIRFVEVRVSPDDQGAMIRAVEKANIDVVVQWSIWPETFGIAARECVAAGAYMVVSASSGAVADFVDQEAAGLVLEGPETMVEAFRSDLVARAVAERQRQGVPVGRLEWSRLSVDLTENLTE